MKFPTFYIKQVLILGSAGFAAFCAIGWLKMGVYFTSDIYQAWLLALLIVAIYLVVIVVPVWFILRKVQSQALALSVGALLGPAITLIFIALFTNYPISFNWYVRRVLFFHVTFSLIGLSFSYSFYQWSRKAA